VQGILKKALALCGEQQRCAAKPVRDRRARPAKVAVTFAKVGSGVCEIVIHLESAVEFVAVIYYSTLAQSLLFAVARYLAQRPNVKLTFPLGHPMGSDHCFVHSAMMRTSVGVWLGDKDMLFTQGSDLAQYIAGSTQVLPARRDILRE
jgi:hypothetical protein